MAMIELALQKIAIADVNYQKQPLTAENLKDKCVHAHYTTHDS